MIRFNYLYNTDHEIEYVKDIIKEAGWLRKNGYKFNLPQNTNEENFDERQAKNNIEIEYKKNKPIQKKLEKDISDLVDKSVKDIDRFLSLFDLPIPEEFNIIFTAYGPGGSYYLLNNIIIKFNNKSKPRYILQGIIHEVIHLIIEEPIINRYQIPHEVKEGMVDLLCINSGIDNLFLDYRMQSISNTKEAERYLDKLIPQRSFKLRKKITETIAKL